MTYEDALNFVDLLTEIAVAEVERSALDADHWEHNDHLATVIHDRRYKAASMLISMLVHDYPKGPQS